MGRWFLSKDIRDYGNGNPGSANVFRAGSIKIGLVALSLDIAKGVPFVFIAHFRFGLPELSVIIIGLSAILGHAFSPFLRFKGGKAIAVTFGVLLAFPQHQLFLLFTACIVFAFLCIEPDAWTALFAPAASAAYLTISAASFTAILFMLCLLAVFAVKQFDDLKTVPRLRLKPVRWYQSRS